MEWHPSVYGPPHSWVHVHACTCKQTHTHIHTGTSTHEFRKRWRVASEDLAK